MRAMDIYLGQFLSCMENELIKIAVESAGFFIFIFQSIFFLSSNDARRKPQVSRLQLHFMNSKTILGRMWEMWRNAYWASGNSLIKAISFCNNLETVRMNSMFYYHFTSQSSWDTKFSGLAYDHCLTSPKLWIVSGPRVMGKIGRPAESKVMGGHRRFGLLLPLFLALTFSEDPVGDGVTLAGPVEHSS